MKILAPYRVSWQMGLFVLTLLLVAGLIGYAEHVAWRQGRFAWEQLRTENLERFNLGRTLKAKVLDMNASLVRYHYEGKGKPADGYRFKEDRDEVQHLLTNYQERLTISENLALKKLSNAFDNYRTEVSGLLKRKTLLSSSLEMISQFIETNALPVLAAGDQLEKAQQEAFDRFISKSQGRILELRGLLLAWSVLLPVGGIVLLGSVYRRTVVPLREKLHESEMLMARQEKLASLGVFAAGVAHEIRNPLMAMKVHLFSLSKHLEPGSNQQAKAAIISDEINRLEAIVKDFLEFARPADPVLSDFDAGELLQEVAELLGTKCQKTGVQIRVETEFPIRVFADRAKIKQVLINLVQNSVDSIVTEGTVTLRARTEKSKRRNSRSSVALEIRDNGQGIPPEVQPRLFEPFFTTKSGGIGLGLSIAMQIVEKHGGVIRVETKPAHGTTFSVLLPQNSSHEVNSQNLAR